MCVRCRVTIEFARAFSPQKLLAQHIDMCASYLSFLSFVLLPYVDRDRLQPTQYSLDAREGMSECVWVCVCASVRVLEMYTIRKLLNKCRSDRAKNLDNVSQHKISILNKYKRN